MISHSPDYVFIDTIHEFEVSPCKETVPKFIEEMAKKYNVCFFISTFEKGKTDCIEQPFKISDIDVSADLITKFDNRIINKLARRT